MARISIIMSVYNCEDTIEKAIDSILCQTYDDWFFIICDDGSNDRTYYILKNYEKKYPKKFLIISNQVNKGLSYSLNHCLRYINEDTEFVARMDGDDISLPERFEKQIEFLDTHKEYGFVGCAMRLFDERDEWIRENTFIEKPSKESFYRSACFSHPTVIIRKKELDKIKYSKDKWYMDKWYTNRCEDYDLWMRLYAEGVIGYNINEILYKCYRGQDALKRIKFRFRVCESIMRSKNYYTLGLYPLGFIYILKPICLGMLPRRILKTIYRKY